MSPYRPLLSNLGVARRGPAIPPAARGPGFVDPERLAREQERRHLRRELHDVVGPSMTAATMRVEVLRCQVADDSLLASALTEVLSDLRQAVSDIRRLLGDLDVHDLGSEGGLAASIRCQAHRFERASDGWLRMRVVEPMLTTALPPAIDVAARRVAAEALTNVAKHSGARTCVIRVQAADEDTLCLEISDDGVGCDASVNAGIGLTNMVDRVAELGGTFDIEPNAPSGTRVVVRLPMTERRT